MTLWVIKCFCTCVPYIHMVHLHKCLEISPTGTNTPYYASFFKLHGQYQLKRKFCIKPCIYIQCAGKYWIPARNLGNLFYTCIVHPVVQLGIQHAVYISCIAENSIKYLWLIFFIARVTVRSQKFGILLYWSSKFWHFTSTFGGFTWIFGVFPPWQGTLVWIKQIFGIFIDGSSETFCNLEENRPRLINFLSIWDFLKAMYTYIHTYIHIYIYIYIYIYTNISNCSKYLESSQRYSWKSTIYILGMRLLLNPNKYGCEQLLFEYWVPKNCCGRCIFSIQNTICTYYKWCTVGLWIPNYFIYKIMWIWDYLKQNMSKNT